MDLQTDGVQPDLVVVGELNIDLVMESVSGLPELGKEKLSEGMTLTMGSSSAILAANASALGTKVGFVGRVGDDLFGAYVLGRLRDRRVDIGKVIVDTDSSTGATVIFTMAGDRGMLTCPGAMERLTIHDIPWDYVAQARHLHLSSYYLQKGLRPDCAELFRRSKELGLSTSLDTNWDPDEEWGNDVLEVLKYVDLFFPNDAEAMQISRTDDVHEALTFFSDLVETIVITCGAEGVVARSGQEEFHRAGIGVHVVDAIGAGDSFNAGYLSGFLKGDSIRDCLHKGLLASAFSTTAAGGTTAFVEEENYKQFIGQVPTHS